MIYSCHIKWYLIDGYHKEGDISNPQSGRPEKKLWYRLQSICSIWTLSLALVCTWQALPLPCLAPDKLWFGPDKLSLDLTNWVWTWQALVWTWQAEFGHDKLSLDMTSLGLNLTSWVWTWQAEFKPDKLWFWPDKLWFVPDKLSLDLTSLGLHLTSWVCTWQAGFGLLSSDGQNLPGCLCPTNPDLSTLIANSVSEF